MGLFNQIAKILELGFQNGLVKYSKSNQVLVTPQHNLIILDKINQQAPS